MHSDSLLKFIVGKSRGFPTATFDWQKSDFSRFFHIKGVKDEESFIEAWNKYVAPSLDAKTGVYKCGSAVAAGDKQSPTSTPNPRKRTAEQSGGQPPALLPTKKVCPPEIVSAECGTPHTMDEGIRNAVSIDTDRRCQ